MKSTQTDCTKAFSQSKHITLIERQQIERWLKHYEKNKGGGGRYPKIYQSHPLMPHLTSLITVNRLSPYAAMVVLEKQGHQIDFCEKTFYNHIGKEGFPIKPEQLPMGRYRRRKRETPLPCRKHKRLKGESIETRPDEINSRKEPGHHEMDLVS